MYRLARASALHFHVIVYTEKQSGLIHQKYITSYKFVNYVIENKNMPHPHCVLISEHSNHIHSYIK